MTGVDGRGETRQRRAVGVVVVQLASGGGERKRESESSVLEDDASSSYGPLYELSELMAQLPIRCEVRGLLIKPVTAMTPPIDGIAAPGGIPRLVAAHTEVCKEGCSYMGNWIKAFDVDVIGLVLVDCSWMSGGDSRIRVGSGSESCSED
ncbi:hypothetical protein RND71_008247 [Anisodus tanguticus]|uniref:Uncharacterized protein n=1 Tax=Anisodus tanguticus TaxID=243964 RepID=A0AAE1VJT2_9SOLA|nr:hypothetical protein RND71_008247 [Anisodus tanguticus]